MIKLGLLAAALFQAIFSASVARAEIGAVRVRPVGLLAAAFGAELEAYPSSRISCGPSAHYFTLSDVLRDTGLEGWELGIRATVLIGPIRSGRTAWYTSVAANYYSLRSTAVGTAGTRGQLQFGTWGGQWVAGHQWDFHLLGETWNARLGAGAGYITSYRRAVLIDGADRNLGVTRHLDPVLEFTLAYQF